MNPHSCLSKLAYLVAARMLDSRASLHKYKYMAASKHILFPKLITVALFVTLVLCPLYVGCDTKVVPGRVVGVWQVDLPAPQKLIYAFRTNGTYKMTMTGTPGALAGSWRIDGRQLVMTMSNFTAAGTTIGFSTVPNQGLQRQHRRAPDWQQHGMEQESS